jgi:hypothetical protein
MFYSTGHETLMADGYAHDYADGPDYREQDTARRAILGKFQSYPQNLVQGGGTLVLGQPGCLPGSAFMEFQPAQVVQNWNEIEADLYGGGVDANGFTLQPLVSGD